MNFKGRTKWVGRTLVIVALFAVFAMGYYLRVPISSEAKRRFTDDEVAEFSKGFQHGSPEDRHAVLLKLIEAHAEGVLNGCLASDDALTVDLATQGLWECWLNEYGPSVRREMDRGIEAMNEGGLKRAETIFTELMKGYPRWAEAINKQATVLYLQGRPEESLVLCQKVVALKPNHFGAWSGMALCAMQMKDWTLARKAAREAVRIHPHSLHNLKMLKTIEGQITDV